MDLLGVPSNYTTTRHHTGDNLSDTFRAQAQYMASDSCQSGMESSTCDEGTCLAFCGLGALVKRLRGFQGIESGVLVLG